MCPNVSLIRIAITLVSACLLAYFFPLFHVRRIATEASGGSETVATESAPKVTNSAVYVDKFWNGPVRRGEGVVDVAKLWSAFDADVAKAKREFGREVGLGGATYFCLRGRGTVEARDKNRCTLSIEDEERRLELELGVLADNTIREAIGVNVNDFANSQDFNSISSALNSKVEAEVIKPIKDSLQPGVSIQFVGCAKVGGKRDLNPLRLVPVFIEVASTTEEP